jgi:hypothetical protein
MTALWPRYPRGWGWCKNFQDKRPTRISAGLCELDAVGDEDGNRWMVGEFLCISFLFSFNSFNSFMYNNPEVDKIVTWFLEVSYSIYSRITLSLYIYTYTIFWFAIEDTLWGIFRAVSMGCITCWSIRGKSCPASCAYANHCYLAFRFSVTQ